jgi:hypothetical protein
MVGGLYARVTVRMGSDGEHIGRRWLVGYSVRWGCRLDSRRIFRVVRNGKVVRSSTYQYTMKTIEHHAYSFTNWSPTYRTVPQYPLNDKSECHAIASEEAAVSKIVFHF